MKPFFAWKTFSIKILSRWRCTTSHDLPTSTFRHFCGRPRLMSSLLGLPNSIQQFKCHTTLYMLSVLSSRLFIIFYVTNVVFARSASADQRLEISGRFFQLSSVCAGAPLRSGHFCGRPVVHLMSSLLLAVGRATFVYILSPSSRLFIIFLGKLLHLVIKVS